MKEIAYRARSLKKRLPESPPGMFSSRTEWNLHANRLTALLNRKRLQGESILDLTESNPTRCGLAPSIKFVERFARPQILSYDPTPKGLPAARRAISDYYAGQRASVNPESIVLTSSTSEAYSFLFRLLCNPGDQVLLPRPSYPLFDTLADLHDIRVSVYDLVYDGEWYIDRDSFTRALNSQTRAVLLLHPSNPAGSFVKEDEREFLVATAGRRGIPLIIDEVFHSFPLDPHEKIPPTFAGSTDCATVVLNGLSKLAGLPQLKLAWMCLGGPAGWVNVALGGIEIIADTFLSVSTASQIVLPEILGEIHLFSTPLHERIRENYSFLRSVSVRDCSLLRSEGGWNAMIRVPATRSDEEWSLALLEKENILVHPGYLFDVTGGPHLVLSLLSPGPEFCAAIDRFAHFFAAPATQ